MLNQSLDLDLSQEMFTKLKITLQIKLHNIRVTFECNFYHSSSVSKASCWRVSAPCGHAKSVQQELTCQNYFKLHKSDRMNFSNHWIMSCFNSWWTSWRYLTPDISVTIGTYNGLPQAITWTNTVLLNRQEETSVTFEWEYKTFLWKKCIWKCLHNVGHFVPASMCYVQFMWFIVKGAKWPSEDI